MKFARCRDGFCIFFPKSIFFDTLNSNFNSKIFRTKIYVTRHHCTPYKKSYRIAAVLFPFPYRSVRLESDTRDNMSKQLPLLFFFSFLLCPVASQTGQKVKEVQSPKWPLYKYRIDWNSCGLPSSCNGAWVEGNSEY